MDARIALVVFSALIPLAGVIWGGWSAREILVLYWAENVVIGVWHAVKLFFNRGPGSGTARGVGLPFFFIVHYGIFCVVHLVFLLVLTKDQVGSGDGWMYGVLFGVLVMFVSHGWRTWQSYFVGGHERDVDVQRLMMAPYGHIVVVHMGIILGGMASQMFSNPLPVLLLIVVGKLMLDLRTARKEEAVLKGDR